MNPTMRKFGYPDSLIQAYDHWCVLLRPEQATLGALVLACNEPVKAFGDISPEGFGELQRVVKHLEIALGACFEFDKLNYLMLMMIDPDVHFHVLPRYAAAPIFGGRSFADAGWPGPPALGQHTPLEPGEREDLFSLLKTNWPAAQN